MYMHIKSVMYALNILQICQLYLKEAEKKRSWMENIPWDTSYETHHKKMLPLNFSLNLYKDYELVQTI